MIRYDGTNTVWEDGDAHNSPGSWHQVRIEFWVKDTDPLETIASFIPEPLRTMVVPEDVQPAEEYIIDGLEARVLQAYFTGKPKNGTVC